MKNTKRMKRYGDTNTRLKLTEKAQLFYNQTDPLSIYEEELEDGTCLYSVRGFVEADDISGEQLIKGLEGLMDKYNEETAEEE